jgi:chromosome segregation ATPase
MPYLAFNLNDGNEFVFDILEERLTIGREASNDIVIDNTFISSFHAEFVRQPDGSYEIVDLKSSNGTFVNGRRVERFRVKGGDRIMFGQLESRFRERAPKGLASDGGSKSVAAPKGQPSREDGKRGDTESIPARDKEDLPKTTPETGKIEVTKPVVQRSPADAPRSIAGTPPVSLIPKPSAAPDPAAAKQAAEMRDEVEKLTRQRDALRAENAVEQKRRDEIRSLDATLDVRRKELGQTQTEITGFKAELEKLRGQVQNARADVENAKTDAGKLDARRRDLGNIESKLDSTRTLVAKAEADLATAQKGLQTLHAEADQQRKDRETALAKLVAEETAAKERVASINQLLATAQKSEAELKSQRSAELLSLEADLAAKQATLGQVVASLAKSGEESRANEAAAAKAAAEVTAASEKLAALQTQLTATETKLKEVTQLQADAQKSEAELKSKRSGELQELETRLAAQKAELEKVQAGLAKMQGDFTSQQAALEKTTEEVKTREAALAKLTAAEAAAAQSLAALQKQTADADAEVKRLTALQADAQKSEAEQRTKRSTELQDLDRAD